MREAHLLTLLILVMALAAAGQTMPAPATTSAAATSPTSAPAPATEIRGVLKSVNRITRIVAVDRQWADVLKTSEADPKDPFVYEVTVDGKSGEFHVEHLLPGKVYDLIVWTTDGKSQTTRWEGAAMD